MTISTEDRVAGPFTGNGAQTVFPFAFKVFAKTDVEFIKTDALGVDISTSGGGLVLDLDYSATLNADQDNNPGGDITYPLGGSAFPVLPATEKVTATTAIPETQLNELPSGSNWNPQIVEDALDKVVMLVQQLSQQIDRMLRGPVSDVALIGALPTAAARALNFLAFNASGDPIVTAGSTPGTVPVSTFMATFVDDTTADLGLTTLLFTPLALALRLATTEAAFRGLIDVPSDQEIQDGTVVYALDTGTANAVLLDMTPDIGAYAEGQKFRTHKLITNTDFLTVDIDGLGPVPLRDPAGIDFTGGELQAGQPFEFMRHTTSEFRVTSALPFTAALPQSTLKDPTIVRDSGDSLTIGAFQAAPLAASSPAATTSASLSRQITNLFQQAAPVQGITENVGAFAVPAEFTAADISFTTGPNNVAAASGTPFSVYAVGDKYIASGTTSNDGTYDVVLVNGGGTDMDLAQAVTAEVAGATVTNYRVVQDETYHMHAVKNDTTGIVDIAVDTSLTGANIGSGVSTGWTQVRRLWSAVLDSVADIQLFTKSGNYCFWGNIVDDLNTTLATLQNPLTKVPVGFSVIGIYETRAFQNSAAGYAVELSSGLGVGIAAGVTTVGPGQLQGNGTNDQAASQVFCETDTAGAIFADMAQGAATTSWAVATNGYVDERIF